MSDALIIRLAETYSNIVHISLDGAKSLTDESFIAIVMNCSNLRYVQFSGNDKNTGKLTEAALDTLRSRPEIGKHLVKLRLTDQTRFDKKFDAAVKALSVARKSLAIEVECTSERDGDVNTWLGGKRKHGYQALGGPGGFDSYGVSGGWQLNCTCHGNVLSKVISTYKAQTQIIVQALQPSQHIVHESLLIIFI